MTGDGFAIGFDITLRVYSTSGLATLAPGASAGVTTHFSFQFTGKTTYTKRVQLGVPKVMLDPLGM